MFHIGWLSRAGGALDGGARRGAVPRGGGERGRAAAGAVLHAGAVVAGAPPAHDPRGRAPPPAARRVSITFYDVPATRPGFARPVIMDLYIYV